MAKPCDVERCQEEGAIQLKKADYRICKAHAKEWKSGGMRLRANVKKHTLRLVEVPVEDG
jgi:hypothetical protein